MKGKKYLESNFESHTEKEDSFKNRLEMVIGGESVRSFSRRSDISETAMRAYLNGSSEPGLTALNKIVSASGVNINWLAAGQGPMKMGEDLHKKVGRAYHRLHQKSDLLVKINELLDLLSSDSVIDQHRGTEGDFSIIFPERTEDQIADFVEQYAKAICSSDWDEYINIPLFNVEASSAHGIYVDSGDITTSLAFKTDWIEQEIHANPENLHLIYVRDDSMEPALKSGEVVMVDAGAANESIRDGIYVILVDGSVQIKRIQRLPNNRVMVMSDNKAYPAFEANLGAGEITIIGRVIWHAGRT